NPAYRPATASDLEQELEPALAEPPTERLRAARTPRLAGRRAMWLGLAGLLALAAILLAVTLIGGRSGNPAAPTRPRVVPSISQGGDARQQARNIAAWVRS